MNISKSPWVLHYDGSSCNGCDIEVLATMTPLYDVERFGIINTGNPKHADVLLLTGGVNAQTAPVIRQLYNMMPDPKVVVACGICACDGGIFKECWTCNTRCPLCFMSGKNQFCSCQQPAGKE